MLFIYFFPETPQIKAESLHFGVKDTIMMYGD